MSIEVPMLNPCSAHPSDEGNLLSTSLPATDASLAENPLYDSRYFHRFDEIAAEHVVPAITHVLDAMQAEIERIEAGVESSWDALVRPIERVSRRLSETWSVVGHLLAVRDREAMRTAQQEIQPKVVEFSSRVGQSRPLYDQLVRLRDNHGDTLDEGQHRVLEAMIRDAELAGVALDGEKQKRFREIKAELAELRTKFQNNVLDAMKSYEMWLETEDDVRGLPSSLLGLAAQNARERGKDEATPEAGPWCLTLTIPCFAPFMEHSQRRDLREKLYRAWISRASAEPHDNRGHVTRILELRRELASLLDFDTYAELSLAKKMVSSVDEIESFYASIRESAKPVAKRDRESVVAFAKARGAEEADDLQRWDMGYWSERLREDKFGFTDEELRPYFPLPNVLQGLFDLVHDVFGATIEPAELDEPVWHEDVKLYQLKNESSEVIAYFYLDPYSRPSEKRGGAWCGTCRIRSVDEVGELTKPIAYLVCNQTPPVGDKPSLMTFGEVTTLFHEFGHGLQHMLTTVDHGLCAGIENVEWDAVELPSQFMENWCYVPEILTKLARHYETGEPLPDRLRDQLIAARKFHAAAGTLTQISYGSIDLALHGDFDPTSQDPFALQREIQSAHSTLPPLPEDSFLTTFSHIFAGAYSAGYYSYLWALVLSADAFAAFEEAGLDDEAKLSETGRRFRDTVLSLGGSRAPIEVFRDFRGRAPKPEALIQQLGLDAG